MGTRRQFSREFKMEGVKLVTERGVSVPQVARDLDIVHGSRPGQTCSTTSSGSTTQLAVIRPWGTSVR